MEKLWKDVGLIGRDKLLKNKILPRINSQTKRFVLKGDAGSGKTAMLEWAHEHTRGKSALISASTTYTNILKGIATDWQLEVESESRVPKTADYEHAILSQQGFSIYVDDIHKASAKTIYLLKILAERHKVSGAMRPVKVKEELKQFLWTCETFRLPRLDHKDSLRLAENVVIHLGSKISHREVASASRGLPGRIYSFARSGEISHEEVRLESEEIDISFIFIGVLIVLVVFKIMGRAGGGTDIAIVGGLLTAARLLIMPLLRTGKK